MRIALQMQTFHAIAKDDGAKGMAGARLAARPCRCTVTG
jgi:hypothetical protein